MAIPLSLLPDPILAALSERFPQVGLSLARTLPSLSVTLMRSRLPYTAEDYAGRVAFSALFNALLILSVAGYFAWRQPADGPIVLGVAGAIVLLMTFTQTAYPSVVARRREQEINRGLINALRQLQIVMKSGVTLFEGLRSVSTGYGEVSSEFRRVVDMVNLGVSETTALQEAGARAASEKLRRTFWQIGNALTTGSDVVKEISDQVSELHADRIDEIKKYTSELNPWMTMYMVLGIAVPALSLSLVNIFLIFFSINLPKIVIYSVPAIILLFNIFFINFVRMRRPAVD